MCAMAGGGFKKDIGPARPRRSSGDSRTFPYDSRPLRASPGECWCALNGMDLQGAETRLRLGDRSTTANLSGDSLLTGHQLTGSQRESLVRYKVRCSIMSGYLSRIPGPLCAYSLEAGGLECLSWSTNRPAAPS